MLAPLTVLQKTCFPLQRPSRKVARRPRWRSSPLLHYVRATRFLSSLQVKYGSNESIAFCSRPFISFSYYTIMAQHKHIINLISKQVIPPLSSKLHKGQAGTSTARIG